MLAPRRDAAWAGRQGTPGRIAGVLTLLSWLFCAALPASAESVILHLKNGDRVAGVVLSENTNSVTLSTTWIKELSVPLSEIERRETPSLASATNAPVAAAPAPATASATNTLGAAAPGLAAMPLISRGAAKTASKVKHWSGEARVGANFLMGAKDQEIYYGRFKLNYSLPYASRPKQFFRNILDYSVDYGRTEGLVSANRMGASDKLDFDVGRRLYVYNLASVGYDDVRKIKIRYEVGPGFGYHLITRTNLVLDVECGADYQVQERKDGTITKDFFPRVGEDLTIKFNHRFSLTESLEFFPPTTSDSYRLRFETTLSYAILQGFSLNLSVLDIYDNRPARDVPANDLQVRASLGLTF